MKKLQTLFDIPVTTEPQDTPPENRVTLNDVVLLSKMQAVTRYNLGATSIRQIADDCGAVVYIGRRVLYHRQTMDEYFESIAG